MKNTYSLSTVEQQEIPVDKLKGMIVDVLADRIVNASIKTREKTCLIKYVFGDGATFYPPREGGLHPCFIDKFETAISQLLRDGVIASDPLYPSMFFWLPGGPAVRKDTQGPRFPFNDNCLLLGKDKCTKIADIMEVYNSKEVHIILCSQFKSVYFDQSVLYSQLNIIIKDAVDDLNQPGRINNSNSDYVRYSFEELKMARAGALFCGLCEKMRACDIAIADFSDLNPNVMFEAGYLSGIGKTVIIVRHEKSPVPPSDIGAMRYFKYVIDADMKLLFSEDNMEKTFRYYIMQSHKRKPMK